MTLTAPVPAIETIADRVAAQRKFFATGQTKSYEFRRDRLEALKQAILDRESKIVEAVRADLGRPEFEAYIELAAITDVNYALKNLKRWMKPQRASVPIEQWPSSAWRQAEPLGCSLILGAWNYPFQLVFQPLVGAIAAGNCAIVKPSEISPNTAKLAAELINETFDPRYIWAVEGDAEVSQALLENKFDSIFFTGSTRIGKIVMAAAAKHLTPVTLELGGKSPCIVDRTAKLDIIAKRIAWGKWLNNGQTCIAPDYILVDRAVKDALLDRLKAIVREFYGDNAQQSPDYGRIVNTAQFDRLVGLLDDGNSAFKTICGGQHDRADRYIAPTILDGVSPDDAIMQDEIFGPILPVLTYDKLEDAIALINDRPKPLALYLFSEDKVAQNRVLRETSSGGVSVNDTVSHVACPELPFGGVGNSGMGSYHGKASFNAFSHTKSVLKKATWFNSPLLYAPYLNKLGIIKKIVTR
ncbi:MAG: aldehyde dehydrogenase [Geitlerinemataceae cyanobacterium]